MDTIITICVIALVGLFIIFTKSLMNKSKPSETQDFPSTEELIVKARENAKNMKRK